MTMAGMKRRGYIKKPDGYPTPRRPEQPVLPWGINTIRSPYHRDCHAGLPDGRWVQAVGVPYPSNFVERVRAAWWVLTGRAHAFVWPKAGDLEEIWHCDRPILTPTPRPFVPLSPQDGASGS